MQTADRGHRPLTKKQMRRSTKGLLPRRSIDRQKKLEAALVHPPAHVFAPQARIGGKKSVSVFTLTEWSSTTDVGRLPKKLD
jgi:hypothetical protein